MGKSLTLSPLIEASIDELTDELMRRSSAIVLGFVTYDKEGTDQMNYLFKGQPAMCTRVLNTVALHVADSALRKGQA